MSRLKNTLDIDPNGGPCDRAAAQTYRSELLRIARTAADRPTRVWMARCLGTSRNRFYRILDMLGAKAEYEAILNAWTCDNMLHTNGTESE